jgi:hypothetical protein
MFNHGLPYGFPSGSVGKSSVLEIDPLLPVVLPPVTLPAVIFPDIVALSLVVCASTEPMTLSPDTDRVAAPASMADIANIVVVFIGEYENSLVISFLEEKTERGSKGIIYHIIKSYLFFNLTICF